MNDQNRVLLRRGARALSEQEVELVARHRDRVVGHRVGVVGDGEVVGDVAQREVAGADEELRLR